jgi:hypothetical protein
MQHFFKQCQDLYLNVICYNDSLAPSVSVSLSLSVCLSVCLFICRSHSVINLLPSQGFTDHLQSLGNGDSLDLCCEDAGIVVGHSPFDNPNDEIRANERLDHFMASVILPLAAQTHAIILCNAISSICALSSSLTRMLAVHGATWGKDTPFTVLSLTGNVQALYRNKNQSATWRGIRRSSRAWRQRDRKILELMYTKYNGKVSTHFLQSFFDEASMTEQHSAGARWQC